MCRVLAGKLSGFYAYDHPDFAVLSRCEGPSGPIDDWLAGLYLGDLEHALLGPYAAGGVRAH